MKNLTSKFRKPLLFVLILIPVAIAAGIFTALYQLELYPKELFAEVIAQLGSTGVLVVITSIQTVGYAVFCGFFGYILADRTGLIKPLKFEKRSTIIVTLTSLVFGVGLFFADLGFNALMPEMSAEFQVSNDAALSISGIIASLLYGGIIEEIMLRLFMMSLAVFVIWKLFCRKYQSAEIPSGVYTAAIIISALLFAVGHLPANALIFGALTPIVVLRCVVLNGIGGIVFGIYYRKYGLHYSILSHMLFHVGLKAATVIMM